MSFSSIGECLRQLRRQRGLTQSELGGEHFSKSYVSATEREEIVPSYRAIRFFAQQLDQPVELFEELLQQLEQKRKRSVQKTPAQPSQDHDTQEEWFPLFDILLEGTDQPHFFFPQEISVLSIDAILDLPLQKQAQYCFMKGMGLQEQGHLVQAQSLLERALVLAPIRYQPVILDALGMNAFLARQWQSALCYHQRAVTLLTEKGTDERVDTLLLTIELHIGNDYCTLGAYTQALEHYRKARQYLRSNSNIQRAAQIYLGLGYCTYASIYVPPASDLSYAEKDRLLQNATSFLLQSRTLYQVSSNHRGEAQARLLYATLLLDTCSLHRQEALRDSRETRAMALTHCTTFLDEAEEQCRQVLLNWTDPALESEKSTPQAEVMVYTALSFLVRLFVQSAGIARIQEYSDTAQRVLAQAVHLCQLLFNNLAKPAVPWSLVHVALQREEPDNYRTQALPHLPDLEQAKQFRTPAALEAVLFAGGEVAEELGRRATAEEYAFDCYTCANAYLTSSLKILPQSSSQDASSTHFLLCSYQHYVALLEERILVAPAMADETYRVLLQLFKDHLSLSAEPISFTQA